ncbi:starch-binding protein [Bacteroidia bacterium]|nr:starch-binding protein [Bacteroidia bacterium]GHU88259.1 starch-binding protein [Bacteroidia bacterium]
MKNMKFLLSKFRIYRISGLALILVLLSSCDYLDVVPDNTPTIDHAFKNRHETLGFLYGCYSFLPNVAMMSDNPALFGWDEAWYIESNLGPNPRMWNIARGEQGTNTPIGNYWSSNQYGNLNGGKALWTAIRDCNMFLENIDKPFDLPEHEAIKWAAEAKFLKAYFHYYLFRMYGPIPIVDENLPLEAKGSEVQLYREPVDKVVEYIANLLDEAAMDLPDAIEEVGTDLGRATKPIALAVKAQLLTLAASPLLNGTETEKPSFSLIDSRGIELFPQTYDANKWQKAAEALKIAIDAAHEGGHALYDFNLAQSAYSSQLSEQTILAMQVRGAVTERWNTEIIWGSTNNTNDNYGIQYPNLPLFFDTYTGNGYFVKDYAPTLRMVETFYSKNGVPINEDKEWENINPYEIQKATANDRAYIQNGFETIKLHFNREPRFYGTITFDGGTFYGNGRLSSDNIKNTNQNYMWMISTKASQLAGLLTPEKYPCTGYLCKKVIPMQTTITTSAISLYRYSFPIIRLADLYLMYSEALNETMSAPSSKVYEYIDIVRKRTGLEGVVDSWSKYAIGGKTDKPFSKAGMRDIIRQERMIELSYEGIRYWDIRRWKLAEEYWNTTIMGLNAKAAKTEDFYRLVELYKTKFEKKDYFWPIKQSELLNNRNLVQNVGWSN